LINEIAAIGLGCILTSPDISSEDKGLIRKELARFEKLEVIYKQNTADELNIVVPEFPEFDDQMRKLQPLSKEEMRQIAGGEIFLTPGIISTITGVLATIGGTMLSVGTVATLANGVVVGSVSAVAAGGGPWPGRRHCFWGGGSRGHWHWRWHRRRSGRF